jgi:hypothetical protein
MVVVVGENGGKVKVKVRVKGDGEGERGRLRSYWLLVNS